MFFRHNWSVFEDIVVCSYAMARKTDQKTIKKLSIYLGISENRISYRMCNFSKLATGRGKDWHFSRQEKKVFDWLMLYSTSRLLDIKPTK